MKADYYLSVIFKGLILHSVYGITVKKTRENFSLLIFDL